MTVDELFEMYQQGYNADKELILCDNKVKSGFRINSNEDFQSVIDFFDGEPAYIIDRTETKDRIIFDFFQMKRVPPTVVVVRHPPLRNAYWKERPDKTLDTFATVEGGVYRLLAIDYGNLVKDFVIEMPSIVDDSIWKLLQRRLPDAFRSKIINELTTLSIVFTNSDRFNQADQMTFKISPLAKMYPSLKKPELKSVSNKLWKEMKKLST